MTDLPQIQIRLGNRPSSTGRASSYAVDPFIKTNYLANRKRGQAKRTLLGHASTTVLPATAPSRSAPGAIAQKPFGGFTFTSPGDERRAGVAQKSKNLWSTYKDSRGDGQAGRTNRYRPIRQAWPSAIRRRGYAANKASKADNAPNVVLFNYEERIRERAFNNASNGASFARKRRTD